ncbi:hypothetical protein EMIHUDRAFT_205653 [Emiliania huxleyi CCMP1516]|uniref:Aldehyde dehydrogenase domain-containing protein n=2 Tax=Emiliania huxleyi TaxID=2903 RepID=A0A0D3JSS6_EMIH1|nr:hypothetical protein EMIHUDRAFT_205653 [Emiliania huxleyi CCMP1516]EOD26561.1 hypothetical protein EMIHUDRAFT_205653 [Emiliania huxleyi CCMP1516]|eukprot:XP_005778990.1 hypothetical protein EMIHUDRAFT_205653 [Emiliania huxleyi CCMP1516]
MAMAEEQLATLSAAAPAWRELSAAEVHEDEWSRAGDWVARETELNLIAAADRAVPGATVRFVFGSILSDWLKTYIAATSGRESLARMEEDAADGSSRYGPIGLGPGAPGCVAELWADPAGASFLGVVDVLSRCLQHAEPVLLKLHPLRPWLSPPLLLILAPLIARNIVAVTLDRGVEEASALCTHPLVGHVHLTGSEETATAVRASLDRAGRPHVGITSELGCATPWLVSPGAWSGEELRHAATLIATAKKGNGGCNCLSAQVVVVARDWPQRGEFLSLLTATIAAQPTVPAYYPGAHKRRAALGALYGARASPVVGASLPHTRLTAEDEVLLLDCGVAGEASFDGAALRTEAFCPALAVYLCGAAVPFVNSDACLGSLSCSILAPASAPAQSVNAAVAALKYGAVGVNAWSVLGYMASCRGGTWGAHPDGPRSGLGRIGNAFGVAHAFKSVVRGPPLSTAPFMDAAKAPPPLLLDALHAALCAPSAARGAGRLLGVLLLRMGQAVLAALGLAPRIRYGAAL